MITIENISTGDVHEGDEIEFFVDDDTYIGEVYLDGEYPQKRIQEFKPASGRNKLAKATRVLNEFITTVFDKNGYKEKDYHPQPSKWNCTFSPFKENQKLCSAVGKNF